MEVRVRTPARIHVTLIDLNGCVGRVDGGAGFAIDPGMVVVVREAEETKVEISFSSNARTGIHEVKELVERAKNVANLFGSFEVRIERAYRPHCGLGSGTQLSLAVAKACSLLRGENRSIRELAELVGRGGTSGIGVAAFEYGGFIVDGGHSRKVKTSFAPSSASKAPPPPVIARLDFPWKTAVVVPELSGFSGKREVDLFRSYCPIPIEEVREVSHVVLMKILPSIAERDLDSFNEGVRIIQSVGFKKVEVSMYPVIKELLEHFDVGMSSTGTAVYTAVESDVEGRRVLKDISRFFEEKGIGCECFIAEPNNSGAEVHEV